jgi:hypothetical protein
MSYVSGRIVTLIFLDHCIKDRGFRSSFRVMGVWSHLPGCPKCLWQANAADEWAWSPLVVSGEPSGPGDEQPEMLSTPRMIPVVGLERGHLEPLWFPLRHKERGTRR